jgi:NAD(P)-dependent dehydrogenase (short-subunit alcohol dehydrogenase family)
MFERGTRVLVTGATSGLGREAARQLGGRGCRLALTGRRVDRLEDAAAAARAAGAPEVVALAGSVTEHTTVQEHMGTSARLFGGLDVAILNAGVGDRTHGSEFTAARYREVLETNVFGACNWIEAVLPGMRAAKSGVIAGVSSPAAWRGLPATGPYCASKAALSTLLESLRVDLLGSGIDVITVCPGFVRSEITAENDPRDMPFLLETDDGVRRMLRGIERRRRTVHFPFVLTGFLRYVLAPMPGFLYDRWMSGLAKRFARRRK